MIYHPEKYAIADRAMTPFIDPEEIWGFIQNTKSTKERVREVIAKSMAKNRLSLEETAVLINTEDPELVEEIKEAARTLKKNIYGERIVLFAPLYIGSHCSNNCTYCGFRADNKNQVRTTLEQADLIKEVTCLEDNGHKRLILVFGEHPRYSPEFIADSVRTVYGVKHKNGEIRRVNINAAPLSIDGFRTVAAAGIGTYQIFQETYHPGMYSVYHLSGNKRNFENRLIALDKAQEAGIDDVGIGALFGLYDWRYEVLGLIRHVNHFEAVYKVGPHTISFPRIQQAAEMALDDTYWVSDADFLKLVAILRLAVPYTGMILTAREPAEIRREVLRFGVSQIDGGTNIEMKGYSQNPDQVQDLKAEQFQINDTRTLAQVIDELVETDYLPSFCTACYRLGRTGEHFMEFSVPGFIKRFCDPNAMLTLAEYLEDYGDEAIKIKGYEAIYKRVDKFPNAASIRQRLEKIKNGVRDLYY